MELIISLFAFLLVGILGGFLAGLLGMSGGVIIVPSLVLLFHIFHFPQTHIMHMAIGTSLAATVVISISSMIAHHVRNGVMWDIVIAMLPGILLGCLLGAFIAHFLAAVILEIIFGLFVCFLGAFVLLQKKKEKEEHHSRPDKVLYTWIGLGIGSLSSMLGIGGGTFTVPLLLSYRYPEKKAVGTSSATGLFITAIAALCYLYFGMGEIEVPYSLGYIYLPAFGLIGIAAISCAPFGAMVAHKIDPLLLRRIFAGVLILIGILMVFH